MIFHDAVDYFHICLSFRRVGPLDYVIIHCRRQTVVELWALYRRNIMVI